MSEKFDSWQGFVDADFAPDEDGALRKGDGLAAFYVRKEGGKLFVRFSSTVPGYAKVEFEFPPWTKDLYDWAAGIVMLTFGASDRVESFLEQVKGAIDPDLEQLIQIGMNHLDELPHHGGTEDDETSEHDESTSDMFVCLRDVIGNALGDASKDLSDAAQMQDWERSKDVMARVERLKSLDAKIAAIENEWNELGLPPCLVPDEADDDETAGEGTDDGVYIDEDGEAVEEAESDEAEPEDDRKVGGKKVKTRCHCTGFAVTFEDGTRIAEAKASSTFAKALEKIGPERVSALNIRMADDPIVTQSREEIRKMPMMVQPIEGGWFVKTHSNTYTKIEFLKRIAAQLGIAMNIETFMREGTVKVKPKRPRGRPRKHHRKPAEHFQIGRVVKWYFPMLFRNNVVTDEEIAFFLSDESKRKYGTRGFPVLKESTGADDDCIVNGSRRYYSDIRLTHNGHTYLLTSQFITANGEAIMSWIESKGYAREEIERIGRGEETVPSLFSNLTCFAHGPKANHEEDAAPEAQEDAAEKVVPVDLVPQETHTPTREANGAIAAYRVKKSLRAVMKRLMYTPRSLAAGLRLPSRLVRSWYKGRGLIEPDEYKHLCAHLAIKDLEED